MFRLRGLGSVPFRACAAAVFLFAGVLRAAPASETGPAYGVEPGEAPKNSVAVGSTAPSGQAPPAVQSAPAPAAPATPPPPTAGQAGTTVATEVSDHDPRALTDFKPKLDPYGKWVEDPKYGLVWVPDRAIVGDGFSPYVTQGHWAVDTAGNWVWVSDFPFGEVVFHYGRWAWTSSYGWSWVPGYRYAPAWVSWRVPTAQHAYVGWAPMPPYYGWWGGIGVHLWWGYPPYYWVFCPSHYLFAHYPAYYVVHDRGFVHTLAGSTRRYSPAPHATTSSPPIDTARVPSASLPSSRVPAATNQLANTNWGRVSPPTPASSMSRSFRPSIEAPPLSRDIPYSSPRSSPARTFAPPRPPSFDAYRAAPRTFAPEPRPYSVAPRPFSGPPSSYSAPSRVYSPPAHTYSPAPHFSAPSRVYSPPARMYSPSPRVYSSPGGSGPAYHAPSSPSFSAPRMAPMFPGGGARPHR